MRSDPPCRPLLVLIVLCIASVASAQVKRFGQSAASGKSAAVLVPGDLPLLHTTQLLPLGTGNSIDAPGDAAAQSALVLQELKDVLGHYNLPLAAVVKVNLAAKNPAALATLQKTVAAAFGDEPPAVTALVSDLAEADALVALDAVAALPAGAADAVRLPKFRRWRSPRTTSAFCRLDDGFISRVRPSLANCSSPRARPWRAWPGRSNS
jgi:enamine deaminase RidA (YjgF/YER057c/UK114 family)